MSNFIIEEFENYKVFLFSKAVDRIEYKVQIKIPSGIILLWFINGELEENHVEDIKGHRVLNCYFRAERYPDFIDILRNEKPLFFYYNREDKTCYITTSDEPVGEGEHEDD